MISHKELINLYDKLFDKDVKEGISEFLRQDFGLMSRFSTN